MEVTYHKPVSLKAYFPFLTEEISFFTIAIYRFPNITLKIPQEQS
ncbi:nef attachable domain protein [Chlamydia psittaci C1/97]|nr:nef attachable domain protein [Chlamydia psittaci C1/97]